MKKLTPPHNINKLIAGLSKDAVRFNGYQHRAKNKINRLHKAVEMLVFLYKVTGFKGKTGLLNELRTAYALIKWWRRAAFLSLASSFGFFIWLLALA